MNPFHELKNLVEEVRGTESDAMKHIAAVSAKIRAKKERNKNAKAAAAAKKGKK